MATARPHDRGQVVCGCAQLIQISDVEIRGSGTCIALGRLRDCVRVEFAAMFEAQRKAEYAALLVEVLVPLTLSIAMLRSKCQAAVC